MDNSQETKAVYVGCAGWSLPKQWQGGFPADGTHLERYAGRFNAVEINSSFYRPHQQKTYRRWAASVPEAFRFSVKLPKAITHTARLQTTADVIRNFVEEVSGLGERLGCWLVQLPPSLVFDAQLVREFFERFREQADACSGAIVCEPRHASWFSSAAAELLTACGIARVAADPAVVPAAGQAGGTHEPVYIRRHGSPHMYYSSYSAAQIRQTANQLRESGRRSRTAWCIFDNTAEGAATGNALRLLDELHGR